jgi:hypothetical protein
MRNLLSKIFGGTRPRKPHLGKVPSYPPQDAGILAYSVDEIVDSQSEIISRIRDTTRFGRELYDDWYFPLIQRYARFVHLLPASQTHHHRGMGGLFRHGLETALYSLDTITNHGSALCRDLSGERRRKVLPCLDLACFAGGLCHDIGKAFSDMRVTNEDGSLKWSPTSESLADWLKQHNIERYFVQYRTGREHKSHELCAPLLIDRVMDEATRKFIDGYDQTILMSMLSAISGTISGHNFLYDYISAADRRSVERDLKANGAFSAQVSSTGVPVERHLRDAMCRLVSLRKWKINEPGARIWILGGNLYIAWAKGSEEIVGLLREDRVPGIPQDMNILADILLERQLAVPNDNEQAQGRYWYIKPAALQKPGARDVIIRVLRLKDAELIIDPVPANAAGEIYNAPPQEQPATQQAGQVAQEQPAVTTQPEATAQEPPSSVVPGQAAEAVEARPAAASQSRLTEQAAATLVEVKPKDKTQEQAKPQGHAQTVVEPPRATPKLADAANNAAAEIILPEKIEPRTLKKTGSPQERKARTAQLVPASKAVAMSQQEAKRDLADQQKAQYESAQQLLAGFMSGEVLHAIAEDLSLNRKEWGKTAIKTAQNLVAIRYPDGMAGYGFDPSVVLRELDQNKWLDLDIANPLRKIRQIKGFDPDHKADTGAIVLEKAVSAAFMTVATAPTSLGPVDNSNISPPPTPKGRSLLDEKPAVVNRPDKTAKPKPKSTSEVVPTPPVSAATAAEEKSLAEERPLPQGPLDKIVQMLRDQDPALTFVEIEGQQWIAHNDLLRLLREGGLSLPEAMKKSNSSIFDSLVDSKTRGRFVRLK